ncbi:hypothetical protein CKO09_03785 [Chromatium weissei]|nr:hypothetical protein [Chromatium weissei]
MTAMSASFISVPAAFDQRVIHATQSATTEQQSPFANIAIIRQRLQIITAIPIEPIVTPLPQEGITTPTLIGESIDLSQLSGTNAMNYFTRFSAPNGGTLLGLRIDSPNAKGIRLGLHIEKLPATIQIAFFTAESAIPVASPNVGSDVNLLLETNRAAGDLSAESKTFWSPVIHGETAIILIYMPNGITTDDIQLSIPKLSHLFQDPLSEQSASYCNLDVSCYADWKDESSGVAKMIYTDRGYSYRCTGSLLNDSDNSTQIPYFLSANHCISTQTTASTLETEWFYQSSNCNGGTRDSRYTRLTGGAQLLYQSNATDTSFMKLNKQPPAGVLFLGWTTATPAINSDVTGIHHPDGDFTKISFGKIDSYQDCRSSSGDYFTCYSASSSTGNYLDIDWSRGTTEAGSSGSALLNNNSQVLGTLWGGNDSCYNTGGTSTYGRFEVAYNSGLNKWLNADDASNITTPVTPIITIPLAPTSVSASDGTKTDRVQITWNLSANATSYEIWRNAFNNMNLATKIGTSTATTYDDMRAIAGTTYYYWVKAVNSAGASDFSAFNSGYRAISTALSTISTLTVNSMMTSGRVLTSGDANWYQFTVSTAGYYVIETWPGTLFDNYMQLYGPNSQTLILEEDDDDGLGNMAKITRWLIPGTYYVKIRAYSALNTGNYFIMVRRSYW